MKETFIYSVTLRIKALRCNSYLQNVPFLYTGYFVNMISVCFLGNQNVLEYILEYRFCLESTWVRKKWPLEPTFRLFPPVRELLSLDVLIFGALVTYQDT